MSDCIEKEECCEMESRLKVKSIEAESVVVRSKCGKRSIAIQSIEDGVGMWIGSDDNSKSFCAVSSNSHGMYIGINSTKMEPDACPVAIFFDGDEPMVQVVKDGELKRTKLLDLL